MTAIDNAKEEDLRKVDWLFSDPAIYHKIFGKETKSYAPVTGKSFSWQASQEEPVIQQGSVPVRVTKSQGVESAEQRAQRLLSDSARGVPWEGKVDETIKQAVYEWKHHKQIKEDAQQMELARVDPRIKMLQSLEKKSPSDQVLFVETKPKV